MPQFRLTLAAKNDLKQIATYTKDKWGIEQRNTYLRQMDERFHKIALNPTTGKPCDYIKPGYRKSSVGSHIIFYTTEPSDLINIIRILHKNSDVEAKFWFGLTPASQETTEQSQLWYSARSWFPVHAIVKRFHFQ